MAKAKFLFAIDDDQSFEQNMTALSQQGVALDAKLGAALSPFLTRLAAGDVSKGEIWDALMKAARQNGDAP